MVTRCLGAPVLLALLALPHALAAGPEEGLVGYWSFDEESGLDVRDSSPSKFHGKIYNPENAKRVKGVRGGGIEFGGSEKFKYGCVVVSGVKDRCDFTKGMTIEAWIKLNKSWTRRDTTFLASTAPSRGPGWRFSLAWSALALISGDGETAWGAGSNPSEHGLFERDRWYHVAATYDGSVYGVYIDGLLAGESEPNLSLTKDFHSRLSIGCYDNGRCHVLQGVMDEVRLYTRAKSAVEILKDARLY